jgi:hypothetical protein
MWTFVANVRGLSREFGLCYHCGENVEPNASQCSHCGRRQDLVADSDALLESAVANPHPVVPLPPPAAPPAPPADIFSMTPVADTGMDGGTSLDLQVDAPAFTPIPVVSRQNLPARPPSRASMVQRAPAPIKEESILSAKELAAAFQLDFRPPGSRGSGGGRRPVRTLAALLLIALIAGGIVMVMRPDWRETTKSWATEKWGTLTASLETPAKPNSTPAKPAQSGKEPALVSPVNKPTVVETPRPPAVTPPKPVQSPEPAVVENRPPVPVPPPTVEPKIEPKPEPPPVAVTPPPKPQPAPVLVPLPDVSPDELTIEQATTRASELRLRAMDAQARGAWPDALQLYEQIQKLPREAWPADLQLRLDIATRRAGNP